MLTGGRLETISGRKTNNHIYCDVDRRKVGSRRGWRMTTHMHCGIDRRKAGNYGWRKDESYVLLCRVVLLLGEVRRGCSWHFGMRKRVGRFLPERKILQYGMMLWIRGREEINLKKVMGRSLPDVNEMWWNDGVCGKRYGGISVSPREKTGQFRN